MADDFDLTPYIRPPVMDVPSGVALAVALLSALPKKPPAGVRKAARNMRKATLALQQAWKESDASATREDKRPADNAVDTAWAGLNARLQAYAALPAKSWPKAPRAADLIRRLFAEGLTFLQLP